MTQGKENDHRKEELYQFTFDEDNRVAFNVLHTLSHFDLSNNEWLYNKHDNLIDRVMKEKHVGKCPTMRRVFKALGVVTATIDLGIAGKVALW